MYSRPVVFRPVCRKVGREVGRKVGRIESNNSSTSLLIMLPSTLTCWQLIMIMILVLDRPLLGYSISIFPRFDRSLDSELESTGFKLSNYQCML